ncbi:hypothetical protein EMIHUDRAFT_236437 [Emiliania huxleyi CCMP1516]|uniref:Lipoyl-binding domain-containing protein n=2 Tax=Emiliania huxleyi TaxID=2903 RepID=A0A0D3JTD9_EMIH1|nr:hypothetical protein EMIHUDRAFT_236437 [Emiliania huxleyi CCMP1516]EOD26774.1 hypothetical protein EMIHUDRAFT_236437 [Emiliania huxleyi CCMP1516]|eukprot:XP_005779203.1 hypothetical protein EMIHUDRAFT_236437 [Emiliania huxleyi CCMP1516]
MRSLFPAPTERFHTSPAPAAATMLARAVRAPAARLAPRWCRQMAVQKFPVPEMGDSISEGTVLELSKQVGDYVALEEVLVVVETDKVTVDVRSPAAGTITKWVDLRPLPRPPVRRKWALLLSE